MPVRVRPRVRQQKSRSVSSGVRVSPCHGEGHRFETGTDRLATNDKEWGRAYMARWRQARRQRLIELAGGSCVQCGSVDQLEFDHRDRSSKRFELSGAGLNHSWARLLVELEKCDLLCHAHHRVKTVQHKEAGGGQNKIAAPQHGTVHCYTVSRCRCIDCRFARAHYRNRDGWDRGISYSEIVKAPKGWARGRIF